MKRIIQETEGEGLESLLGKRVILLCAAYFSRSRSRSGAWST